MLFPLLPAMLCTTDCKAVYSSVLRMLLGRAEARPVPGLLAMRRLTARNLSVLTTVLCDSLSFNQSAQLGGRSGLHLLL